jgi:type IV pilus assembly protein PilC
MAKKAAEKIEFIYDGTDRSGKKLKGEVFALNEALAKGELRKQGINPLRLKKKPKPLFGGTSKIKPADIAIFSRQMATMMASGVPLVQSFEIIGHGHDNPAMQKMILEIKTDVEGGSNFAEALKKFPLYFDQLFVNLVNAGEQSGALETMLDKLATYKEKTEALKAKVKKAMTYPIAVLVVAFVVTAILLLFVVPQFEEVFSSFGADLPAPTLFVIALSEFMQASWYFFIAGVGVAFWAYKQAHSRSAKFRKNVDKFTMRIPVLGEITTSRQLLAFHAP